MPHIPRAICGNCNVEMRCVKTGVDIEMLLENGDSYYKVQADRLFCKRCRSSVLVGFAGQPFAEKHHRNYEKFKVDMKAEFYP